MNTRTAHFGSSFHAPHAALRPFRRAPEPAQAPVQAATHPGWVERLAAWADRQPMHHRMGSWTRLG